MHNISSAWLRFFQIVAFVAVATAAFEFGVMWQARRGNFSPAADTLVKKRGVLHCIGITVPGYVNVLPLIGEAM